MLTCGLLIFIFTKIYVMVDELEYNSQRTALKIPEYGRHVQKLVDYCVTLTCAEERQKMANAIVDVMGNLQPHLRDVPDFKHKLWDQIFIMSDFKLQVQSPYEKPIKEQLSERPQPLSYPIQSGKYRYYGHHIVAMIKNAATWQKQSLQEQSIIYMIANHMKKSYLAWNKDSVEDKIIFQHLCDLSDGKINLSSSHKPLIDSNVLLKNGNHFKGSKHTKKKQHKKFTKK